jgi:predicted HAD superfamily Cof-like phosphohydrolase
MSDLYDQALAFRRGFEFSDDLTVAGFQLQKRLINEEYYETMDAAAECLDHHFSVNSRAELLKELADLVFVCYQMAAYLGMDLDEAMDRVFKSNMSKLGEDGKPVRREDGKVLKGPGYRPPELLDLVLLP